MDTVLTIYFESSGSIVEPKVDHHVYKSVSLVFNKDLSDGLKRLRPDAVIVELMNHEDKLKQILKIIRKYNENMPVIVVGPSGNTRLIVECIKMGVFDYVPELFRKSDLNLIINSAFKHLTSPAVIFEREDIKNDEFIHFFGVSRKISHILEQVKMIAMTDMCVLIQGASGTGKEVIAHLIHSLSLRKKENFIPIDCGALPEPLLESELFGYERGAFTGAYSEKPGMIELAHKGTLFLDEIGNLSVLNQTKFLRFMEDRKVQRLGGRQKKLADVRVIAATNIDLQEAVKEKKFRLDLYHRLSEFVIKLPLLIERREDIPILGNYFLKQAEAKLKKKISGISPEAMEILLNYEWPGNVRELKHIITSAALKANDVILPEHFEIKRVYTRENSDKRLDFYDDNFSLKSIVKQAVREVEKKYITQALIEFKGNRSQAARKLKIDRSALYQKIREYHIEY